jgi:hypothetical protein
MESSLFPIPCAEGDHGIFVYVDAVNKDGTGGVCFTPGGAGGSSAPIFEAIIRRFGIVLFNDSYVGPGGGTDAVVSRPIPSDPRAAWEQAKAQGRARARELSASQ